MEQPGTSRKAIVAMVAVSVPVVAVIVATLVLASPEEPAAEAEVVAAASTEAATDPATSQVTGAGHARHAEDEDDLGLSALENGHQHGAGVVDLDQETELRLHAQLAQTLDVAERYPTVADAEAAGFRRAGPFSPGLGTHYLPPNVASMNSDGDMDPEDLDWPVLIYDGWEPDSPVAGFMYMADGPDGEAPRGFIGPNDHWHYHTDVCIVYEDGVVEAPLGADRSATKAQCDQFGGFLIDRTGHMVHVWTVPGYESDKGVFSEVNPALACPDGTYYEREDRDGLAKTTCRV